MEQREGLLVDQLSQQRLEGPRRTWSVVGVVCRLRGAGRIVSHAGFAEGVRAEQADHAKLVGIGEADALEEVSRSRYPTIVCGDFNAGPDSDEIRITGRSTTAAARLVFCDAREEAGDGTPGYTWSNRNPLAALGLYPDRRFDYILSPWPRSGGVVT
jgi:endonuclease/exonuclease/phosphatase family metal-dependent hydrolase